MKKFNIRKVLDGLTAASSSSSATAQPGTPKENDVVQETLQSEHFQLCKVGLPVNAANIRLFFLFIWDDCCVTKHLFSCVSTAYYVGCKITKNICEGGFEGSAVHLLKYKSWYNSMDNVSDCAAYFAWFHCCIQSCHSELLVCVALNPRLQSPFLHSKSAWSTITSGVRLSCGCFIFLLIYYNTHVPHSKRLLAFILTPLSQLAFKRSLLKMI